MLFSFFSYVLQFSQFYIPSIFIQSFKFYLTSTPITFPHDNRLPRHHDHHHQTASCRHQLAWPQHGLQENFGPLQCSDAREEVGGHQTQIPNGGGGGGAWGSIGWSPRTVGRQPQPPRAWDCSWSSQIAVGGGLCCCLMYSPMDGSWCLFLAIVASWIPHDG